MHVFSLCSEILKKLFYILRKLPKFSPILLNFCLLLAKMTEISTFLKIELHASYVHQKKAKVIQKLVLGLKNTTFWRKY